MGEGQHTLYIDTVTLHSDTGYFENTKVASAQSYAKRIMGKVTFLELSRSAGRSKSAGLQLSGAWRGCVLG